MGIPEGRSTYETVTATIGNGTSLSGAVDIEGLAIVGIVMPATWTTAGLTFQGSPDDGSTYVNLYDLDGEKAIDSAVAIANAMIIFTPTTLLGIGRKLKIRSGTSATPVNQGGDRVLTLIVMEV